MTRTRRSLEVRRARRDSRCAEACASLFLRIVTTAARAERRARAVKFAASESALSRVPPAKSNVAASASIRAPTTPIAARRSDAARAMQARTTRGQPDKRAATVSFATPEHAAQRAKKISRSATAPASTSRTIRITAAAAILVRSPTPASPFRTVEQALASRRSAAPEKQTATARTPTAARSTHKPIRRTADFAATCAITRASLETASPALR